MKHQFTNTRFAMPVLAAMIMAACNGGVDLAGIGGSGFISSGTVTGFGSVFVNGVEYETDQSTFNIEGVDGSQQDLRIGMVVQLTGNVNADGITGTATSIRYSNELQGPVADDIQDLSPTEKSFTIMGQTVIITQADTAYEGVDFGSIVQGNVVEVSGFYDQNGDLQASYVKLKSSTFDGSSEVEVKGLISNLSSNLFTIQGITVDTTSVSVFEGFSNGLQEGLLVDVKGTFDVAANRLRATQIEAEDDLFDDADEVEIEGYITSYTDNNHFEVNGIPVDASNISSALQLSAGIKIEVEGTVVNGVLIADEIELRGGNAEISARVDTIDIQSNSFTLEVISTQPSVTVQISSITRMEDDAAGSDDHLLLSELQMGDFVDVLGFEEGVNTVAATRVKREAEIKDTELQGVVTAHSNNSVTVLGVAFTVDDNVTDYEDGDGSTVSNWANFITLIDIDQTVISIEDKVENGGPDGVADSVEIED